MPGSTPMMVPRKQPRNVYQRLIGCRQTAKPFRMWVSVSIGLPRRMSRDALGQVARRADDERLRSRFTHRKQRPHGAGHVGDPLAAVEPRHQSEQVDRWWRRYSPAVKHHVVAAPSRPPRSRALNDAPDRTGLLGRLRRGVLASLPHLEAQHARGEQQRDPEQPGKRLGPQRVADLEGRNQRGRVEIDRRDDDGADEDDPVGHHDDLLRSRPLIFVMGSATPPSPSLAPRATYYPSLRELSRFDFSARSVSDLVPTHSCRITKSDTLLGSMARRNI